MFCVYHSAAMVICTFGALRLSLASKELALGLSVSAACHHNWLMFVAIWFVAANVPSSLRHPPPIS